MSFFFVSVDESYIYCKRDCFENTKILIKISNRKNSRGELYDF